MSTQRPDTELWKEVTNNSSTAFSSLFERYWSVIYKTVYAYIHDREQSEEITHDIFMNLWRGRHTLTIHSFPAYLRASARYHVYRFFKSVKTLPINYTDDWTGIPVPGVSNAGDEKMTVADLETDVYELLTELPVRCKEIFLLSRKEDLSNDEIAGRLGISKRSVENQITRALKHLRVQLKALILIGCMALYAFFS